MCMDIGQEVLQQQSLLLNEPTLVMREINFQLNWTSPKRNAPLVLQSESPELVSDTEI